MKKRLLVISATLLITLLFALAASAQDGPIPIVPDNPPVSADSGEMIYEGSNLYFVEFASTPLAAGGNRAALKKDLDTFHANASKFNLDYTERFAFSTLWNGVSVEVAPGQIGKLSTMPGVVAVYPVVKIDAPELPSQPSPELFTAIEMTGADLAQASGYTGQGVKVAVMDTGIDYDHPDLGGCFGEGCRVAYGYDLVGDDFDWYKTPEPDDDPDDCGGHGTHVAGIVGANGAVVGVAPEVTFGAYRVFGCEGSTSADIMIAAMEMALADGMDILNMSIGSAFTWPQYPTAVASNALVDQGMVVVASIGNSGASGTFSAGAPGLGEKVIGVASFDNVSALYQVAEVDGPVNDFAVGINPMTGSGAIPAGDTEEVVYLGLGCDTATYLADPDGKIALITRGSCTFAAKASQAIDAGAVGVIVHNSSSGNFGGTLGAYVASVPVVSISGEEGLAMQDEITAGVTMVTWTDYFDLFPSPTGGLISSFSSYGLAPDLSLKPDLGAPGGGIFSTYPLEYGGYAVMGGTSMASPHVAGAAALYLQAHPGTDALTIRDVFQNTADPADWSGAPGLGLLEPAFRQGAGMIDIDDAIMSSTIISPGKLSLGASEGEPFTGVLTLNNSDISDVTYTLGYMKDPFYNFFSAGISTTGTFAEDLDFWFSDEYIMFNASEVTVPAGGSADVEVTIYPPIPGGAYELAQYGGWLTFTPAEGDPLRVPYAGFLGDYQSIEVLTPGPYGFPLLGKSYGGGSYGPVPEGYIFNMQDETTMPSFLIHLEHQSQYMVWEVFDAKTDLPVHPEFSIAYEEWYLPRNSTSGGFYAWTWDGTRFHNRGLGNESLKDVKDGQYYVVISVLKALGDPDNEDHWEHWTSPMFEIKRPGRGRN